MVFGPGRKNRDGKQVRLEHRGKYTRASRTGGVAVRAAKKVGRVNLTANSARGVRASTRIARGTRIAFQNSRFQLIGRYRKGPFNFNLSKTGFSLSTRNKAGALNLAKPQYSSFRFAGIHLRGRKAAQLQTVYLTIMGCWLVIRLAFYLLVMLINISLRLLWWAWLLAEFLVRFAIEETRQLREQKPPEE